jgi:hypothetical protein
LKAVIGYKGLVVCLLTVATGEVFGFDASIATPAAVPPVYRAIANEHDVPADVLYAVALTESGTYVKALNARLPWPWTLNIAGKGSYYSTRVQALRAAREALDGGIRSIDLGLMQVNWRYHADALGSLEAAIDPSHNLTVGARILATCHARRGDWFGALECYHAPNHPSRAKAYRQRVERAWRQLSAAG